MTSKDQVYELIKVGERNRHYGTTQMNEHSSRSHALFRLVIESRQCASGEATDSHRCLPLLLLLIIIILHGPFFPRLLQQRRWIC